MSTIGALALTYADWAKRQDNDGQAEIIELLAQTNDILNDALVVEANGPTGHVTTVRTGLPNATWRLLNYGVQPTKSTTAKITDGIGMLETYSIVDKSLADLNGNSPEFRLSEDMAFLEGMSQQMASTMFYGNTAVNPERFTGLAPRYNSTNTATAQSAANVISLAGTTSTCTSIWGVTWGPRTVHMIFPKGQKAGFVMKDKGDAQSVVLSDGSRFEAYTTHFKWDNGLTLRDWRYVFRLCNIDVATLGGATPPNLINALIRGVHRWPTQPGSVASEQTIGAPGGKQMGEMGRCALYANRTIRTYLDIQAVNKTNVLLNITEWDGIPITTFRGVPIRTCDALLNTETAI